MFAKVKKMHFDISPSLCDACKDACVGSSDNSDRDPYRGICFSDE